MSSMRNAMLETTCTLLESQGYHATGLHQILIESKAPKGSLYYYFPGGKEELAAEAIARAGRIVAERIRSGLAQQSTSAESVKAFVNEIAYHVENSGFSAGGPLMTVALETVKSSERINLACQEAYRLIQLAFRDKLVADDYSLERAEQLAIFINASIEGGIILSRTQHSGDALRRVANELGRYLSSLPIG